MRFLGNESSGTAAKAAFRVNELSPKRRCYCREPRRCILVHFTEDLCSNIEEDSMRLCRAVRADGDTHVNDVRERYGC